MKKRAIFLTITLFSVILIGLPLSIKVKADKRILYLTNLFGFVEPDRELGWRLKADYHGAFYFLGQVFSRIKINAAGIRGKEIAEDLKDKFVVLCLGDSSTFGWGLDSRDTWPYLLEKKMNKEKLAVLNGGTPGYNISQIKKHFIKDLLKLNPDLIIVMGGMNDTIVTRRPLWDFPPPFFIRKEIFKYHLVSLIKIFKRDKIRAIFMTEPILGRYKEVDEINKIIRNVCRQLNINLVDTANIFRRKESKDLYAKIDQATKMYLHPSRKGNKIIVQELIKEMKKMGIP